MIYKYPDLSICTLQDSIFSFSSNIQTHSHFEVIYIYPDLSICTIQDSIFSFSSNIQARSHLEVIYLYPAIYDSILSLQIKIQDSLTPRSDLPISCNLSLRLNTHLQIKIQDSLTPQSDFSQYWSVNL